jgi:hypothetical protein
MAAMVFGTLRVDVVEHPEQLCLLVDSVPERLSGEIATLRDLARSARPLEE